MLVFDYWRAVLAYSWKVVLYQHLTALFFQLHSSLKILITSLKKRFNQWGRLENLSFIRTKLKIFYIFLVISNLTGNTSKRLQASNFHLQMIAVLLYRMVLRNFLARNRRSLAANLILSYSPWLQIFILQKLPSSLAS